MIQSVPSRRLADLHVGALGLGCMGMSPVYGWPDRAEAQRTIDRALELGITLFDTADIYGAGGNERFLGRILGSRRSRITLATKVGLRVWPVVGMPRGVDGRPERIRKAIDRSLRRLRTDHVDLYYLHRPDPQVPIEDSVGALSEVVAAGKAVRLGLSEVSADELRRAHAVHPIAALQSEWSLFSRDLEAEVVPTARELGVTIVPYSPLGRGMLTGSAAGTTKLGVFDYRRMLPRWRPENLAANVEAVERVRSLADDMGATPAQVALAWLLQQGEDVIPIPGTTKVKNLERNAEATTLTLSADQVAELGSLTASGAR